MSTGMQVAIIPPIGQFADEVTLGYGARGNFNLIYNDHLNLATSIGYYTWVGNNEMIEQYSDYKFSSVPITIGLKYLVGNSEIHPYALAELALHITSSSYLLGKNISDYYTVYTEKVQKNESCLGVSISGGIAVPMDDIVSIDTSVKFSSIVTKEMTRYYLSFLTGITVLIKT